VRVLVGTVEIAGMLPDFADGFRELGHDVTTVVSTRHPFYEHFQYDVDLQSDVLVRRGTRWLNRSMRAMRITKLIAGHDLFVFMWAGGSLRWGSEVPLLKRLGKRIVWVFCGDDVRHSSAYEQEFTSMVLSEDHRERLSNDPLMRPLRDLRLAELYSDLIISQPNQAGLAVRPYNHFFLPVNLSHYMNETPGREVPVIVHAPSAKSVKGTGHILRTLERLKAERRFELRLLDGVSNQQVLSELAQADVVIDQLHLPLHGKLGVEALASGCVLATCNREDYEPMPPNRPIWHIDPENLYGQLLRLLNDRELRVRLAHEGRAYVDRYHAHSDVARRILAAVNAGAAQQYDHYPSFFARSYNLPNSITIPENFKRMTTRIVRRWGLPEGVDPQDMIRRGLMSAKGLQPSEPIPRWRLAALPTEATTL
jgi:Glycosyl transferases group 1